MELVPILSTIILVGTIATFILAVFAYILYKVRERKSRERSEQRPYREPMRQPTLAAQQSGRALPHPQTQRMQSPMYIAPTTTLPPQGPVVEVDEVHEVAVPQQGWGQPPRMEQPVPAHSPSGRPRNGDGGNGGPPRLAAPQYEPAGTGQRGEAPGSSLFWEYTDAGFVPVDPKQSASREQQRPAERPSQREDEDSGSAWL
jgi:hypothetical protein